MMNFLLSLDNWQLALLGGILTWSLTAIGASLVFFFKEIQKNVYNMMLGFAAGVMIAASVWSLIIPAVERAEIQGAIPWLVAAIGILAGSGFLYAFDKIMPHIHFGKDNLQEGIPTKLSRNILLVFSITLHNIPEGLAVGVAFGAVGLATNPDTALLAALAVAIGIGIQNFPEGAAVSIPLRQEGNSRRKSFFYGQASALVEPVFAVIGAILVNTVSVILPYALTFAAGAMIYVVIEELIPESKDIAEDKAEHLATFGFVLGFIIMMVLDIALG
ncbi:ZIP family metal transporter [Acholeplasma vituli]|uniref:ZIP family metal transporter n=1 Tax=Paracholeplasma vituli TaxID=69473 RepID=A0ABT2PUY1_9MOLU|nr:ZIP family metal transporter [Paracholeplasma vituli]MCU0104742.1 ZIP family metal transporter [Paracholeplasma vituli]